MKKVFTKILSFALSLIMIITTLPLVGVDLITTTNAKTISEYNVGDIIEFGLYPQSEVTDEKLLTELNSLELNWNSYNYYTGTGYWDDGQMQPSDYMKYFDVVHNGTKYRAVTFSQYRPYMTGHNNSGSNYYQLKNGYYKNKIYWFKYEPLQWRVLDPDEGFVVCENIIDSQAYNNTVYYNEGNYYQDKNCENDANNYAMSSIRIWLNEIFLNVAFTYVEENIIQNSLQDNSGITDDGSKIDREETNDKIFLLSYDDVINSKYGFSSDASYNDMYRSANKTDYAKIQGLDIHSNEASGTWYKNIPSWWLCSPHYESGRACYVLNKGNSNDRYAVANTSIGVRPALKINPNIDLLKPNEQTITGNLTGKSTDNQISIDGAWYEYDTTVSGLAEVIDKIAINTNISCKIRFGKIVACSKNEIKNIATMSINTSNNIIEYDITTNKYNPENISLSINITNNITSSSRGKINTEYIAGYDVTFDKIVINVYNGDMLYFKDGWFGLGKTQEVEKQFDTPITLKAGESFDFSDDLTAFINDYKWSETELKKDIQISAIAYNGDDVVTSDELIITFKNNTAENAIKNNEEAESESQKSADILDGTNLIISNAFLSDIFTNEQLKSIQNALQCKIALCALPESTYKQAGIEDKLIEKLMKKAGVSKDLLGSAYRADISLTVSVDTEKYGQLKVKFNMPIDYYSFGSDNPYGGTNFGFTYEIKVVKKGTNEIPSDKLSGTGLSLGTYANMDNFSNSVQKVALSQLESAYNLGYGDDLNKVGDMLFGDTITKILSKTSAKSYSHLTFSMMTFPAKKASIRCPVDVYAYDTDGNLCASVENNEITMTCDDIDIEVVGDEKYLTIYDGDYSLDIIATANDKMNITIEEYSNSDEMIRTVSFDDISLTPGDSFKTDIDESYLDNEYQIIKNEEENISADIDETYIHYVDSVKIIDKEATCTEDGEYHIECAKCNEIVLIDTIPAKGHNYGTIIATPTCIEHGYTTYTCECGDSYVDDYVDATGHDYASKITTPATHLTTGIMTYNCYCGDSYTEVIEKIVDHNHEAVVTIPTCTEQGYTTYTCECGDSYVDDYVDAMGHTPANTVEENYVAPTCTEKGSKDIVIYCSVCEEEIRRETETIEATGHADNDGDGYCDADNELLDPSVECDHTCHKGGISGFIWKIINFFNKLFGLNKTCDCGVAHY